MEHPIDPLAGPAPLGEGLDSACPQLRRSPRRTIVVVRRRLVLYEVTAAELEELTSPRLTFDMSLAGSFLGAAVASVIALVTIPLDVSHLLGFVAAASSTATGSLWCGLDAMRTYRKRR